MSTIDLITDFTGPELDEAFKALQDQLDILPVRSKDVFDRLGFHERRYAKANEFMLMSRGDIGVEHWQNVWAFKHWLTRNYVYVRVKDHRLWIPFGLGPFNEGLF